MVLIQAVCGGCDAVSSVDEQLLPTRCSCGGNIQKVRDLEAYFTARLAHRLGGGHYVHSAIMDAAAATNRDSPIDWKHTRGISRKDGTAHVFSFDHYLREAFENEKTKSDLDRVWITGALLLLADALQRRSYFDRAPILELVRHLRNGAAHGNRFKIVRPEKLIKHPANNFSAAVRSPTGQTFEITPALQGASVMFEYMGPADYADLFFSVEMHLFSLAR